MPRVICDLPNASDEISGIKFHPLDEGGVISDEIDEETAALLSSIPGYSLDDGSAVAAPEPVQAPAPTARKSAGKKAAAAAVEAAPAVVEPEPAPEAAPAAGEDTVF